MSLQKSSNNNLKLADSRTIYVHTLGISQPPGLQTTTDLEWTIYSTLSELEKELLSEIGHTYHLCILAIEPEQYFNEILVALRLRNRGIPVIICTSGQFPEELVKDILSFLTKCATENVQVRAEILLDEYALDLVDKEEMENIIRYFENEML